MNSTIQRCYRQHFARKLQSKLISQHFYCLYKWAKLICMNNKKCEITKMTHTSKNKITQNKEKWLAEFYRCFFLWWCGHRYCATTYEFPETTTSATSVNYFGIFLFVCSCVLTFHFLFFMFICLYTCIEIIKIELISHACALRIRNV